MNAKIDRAGPRGLPRTASTEQAVPTEKSEAVTPATSQSLPVPRELSEAASEALKPTGAQVTMSADPGTLWGASPRDEAVAQFRAMTPAERKDRLEQVTQQREQVRGQIGARVDELDRRWNQMRPHDQAKAMGEYERHSRQLDPETRRELRHLLRQADEHHARVETLQQQVQSLGTTKADKVEKAELKKELKAAEKAETKVVQQAVQAVDDKGLKLDRLAETEKLIDPGFVGPSLLSLIDKFVDLSWLVDTFQELLKPTPEEEQEKHDLEVAAERQESDLRKDLDRKLRAMSNLRKDDVADELRRAAMGHQVRGRATPAK
jgi:hypothetical protein